MRKIILASFLFPAAALAQPNFTEHIIDSSAAAMGSSTMITGDFNNDGFTDVASSYSSSDEIVIHLKNGAGGYGPRQIVSSVPNYPVDLAAADFNGNGWQDLVSISLQDKQVAWYPNQNGSFASPIVLDSVFVFPEDVVAEDFTNNGFTDIVTLDDTAVSLYENDGVGNFTASKIAGKTEFYSIGVADINGDSLLDVLLGSTLLYTYINNGDGTFTRDTRNEPLISNFIFEIEMGDLDGDGDQDMAVYYSSTNSDIDWYENDGTGKFSFGKNITANSNDVSNMKLIDLNQDNHPDFLTGYGQTGELVWMENDGQGNFSSENVLKTYPVLLRHVAAADADQDGDIDIFCAHNQEGLFYWENLTSTIDLKEISPAARLYPNPAGDQVYLETTAPGSLKVLDVRGSLLREQVLDAGKNSLNLHLAKGTYLLQWTEGKQSFSEKLIIE